MGTLKIFKVYKKYISLLNLMIFKSIYLTSDCNNTNDKTFKTIKNYNKLPFKPSMLMNNVKIV
jgi:hypothetical protein